MLVVFDSGGNLVKLSPENVYQGSNKANTVYLILPQPPTAVLEARFTLPNGIITKPIIVPVSNETGYLGFKDENDNQLYLYAFSILGALTSFVGGVSCQITAKTQGTTLGTYTFTFNVLTGVPPIEVEEIDSYEAIIQALESLNISITNNLQALDTKITETFNKSWKLTDIPSYTGDLNALLLPSSYIVSTNSPNKPQDFIGVGVIYTLNINSRVTVQYLISNENKVYIRAYDGSIATWSEWEILAVNGQVVDLQSQITNLSNRLNELVIGGQTDIFVIVSELPEQGFTNKIYLVPISDGENPNLFDEYIWVNNSWEYLGQSGLSIDTSNFVTKQDFIVGSSAPTTSTIAPFVGALYLDSAKNNTYQCTAITTSEGEPTTYTWAKIIRETDYADGWVNAIVARTGIVTVYPNGVGGISVASGEPKGRLAIAKALQVHIDERIPSFYEDANTFGSNYCRPIVPANVDYAHYQVIINPKDRANSSSDKWSWSENDKLKGMKFYNAKKFLLGCNIPLTITSVSNGTYTATIYTKVSGGDYLITADNAYLQITSVTENQGQTETSDDYIKPSPNAVTITTTYTITFTAVASGTFTAVANDFFYVAHSNGTKILSAYYTASELEALSETWTFTLDDDTTVTKKVVVLE
jgi:hypothetical protein